ncbi:hypothetical protein B0H14DRAFT_3170896 [Mycena olivaceomarginata]|nr:hypothetical protein B0H14DRAFT_3170896 [Mycena olivaceomarginata]
MKTANTERYVAPGGQENRDTQRALTKVLIEIQVAQLERRGKELNECLRIATRTPPRPHPSLDPAVERANRKEECPLLALVRAAPGLPVHCVGVEDVTGGHRGGDSEGGRRLRRSGRKHTGAQGRNAQEERRKADDAQNILQKKNICAEEKDPAATAEAEEEMLAVWNAHAQRRGCQVYVGVLYSIVLSKKLKSKTHLNIGEKNREQEAQVNVKQISSVHGHGHARAELKRSEHY